MADALQEVAPLKKRKAAVKTETVPVIDDKKVILDGGEEVEKGSKEHIALTQEFDSNKNYVFQLANENLVRELPVIMVSQDRRINRPEPHKKFKPWQNIVFSSQIVWKNQRRNIRYYDGCGTIFQDKQPKEKEMIEMLIRQTQQRAFIDGKIIITGDERQLLLFMFMCSWNVGSPFRTRTADGIFLALDKTKEAGKTASKIDKMMEALRTSKEATDTKMLIHANFLGIPETDWDSNNPLSIQETRTLYMEEASKDPFGFLESYGNKAIEVKYYINKALLDGTINTKFNSNKAVWGSANTEICDISGLRSHEAIAEKLLEFSQLEAGFEFSTQIRNLYNK